MLDGLTAPLQQASTPTLPQPYYPGVNGISSATASVLDPNFRPNEVDSFNLTIQRQLSRKVILEVGYIGRRITHEYQPVNLNAVPYMMTLGGQKFSQAYANLVLQYCGGAAGLAGGGCAGASTTGPTSVTPQQFFETALGGTSSHYCSGFPSCTAAVVYNEGNAYGNGCTPGVGSCVAVNNPTTNLTRALVWNLWSDLDAGPMQQANGGALSGPTMMNNINAAIGGMSPQMSSGPADNASTGYGNYNAGFASLKMADWKVLTMQSNFTYSKALGTGALVQATSGYTPDDPFNLGTMYGNQTFNRKFVYNFFFVYQPPFFKGQSGLHGTGAGRLDVLVGVHCGQRRRRSRLFTSTGDGQEYGAGDNVNFFGNENAVQIAPITHGHAYYNSPGGQFARQYVQGRAYPPATTSAIRFWV